MGVRSTNLAGPAGAKARHEAVASLFAAHPDRAFTLNDVYEQVRRQCTLTQTGSAIEKMVRAGRIEIVTAHRGAIPGTYRLAAERRSA